MRIRSEGEIFLKVEMKISLEGVMGIGKNVQKLCENKDEVRNSDFFIEGISKIDENVQKVKW